MKLVYITISMLFFFSIGHSKSPNNDTIIEDWSAKGVIFEQPTFVAIDPDATIGNGTSIGCGVHIIGSSTIGAGCSIGHYTIIKNCIIGDNVLIHSHCVLENSIIESQAEVGPFARISEKSEIKQSAVIGNFVEVKRSSIGEHSKAKHLTYLGNTTTGQKVNIGGGTITCNYNGVERKPTLIEDNAFIGSNNTLVAPVTIGIGAFTAAGSTITTNVPSDAFAIARSRQITKESGYASELLAKFRSQKTQH